MPTHASTPPTPSTLPTLAHHRCQHATHASTLPTPPTLARHPRKYATHGSTSPTQAPHPHYPRQHATHASTPPSPLTLARIARHFSSSLVVNSVNHFYKQQRKTFNRNQNSSALHNLSYLTVDQVFHTIIIAYCQKFGMYGLLYTLT